MKKKNSIIFLLSILLFVSGGVFIYKSFSPRTRPEPAPAKFDGGRALQDVYRQTDLGPRIPNSDAHAQARAWMQTELEEAGWQVDIQPFEKLGHKGYNLIASHGEADPEIILGAHYDSRIYADHDPDVEKRNQAVLGANDGASGVAILLELARKIPAQQPAPHSSIWLVFFDLEDNGNIPKWKWILGSQAFVDGYTLNPDAVIILDMLGDADLNIYLEKNSDPKLRAEIWAHAAVLGYEDIFIAKEKFSMLDDHTPFLEAGLPAIDIIDFDYPYWHTTEDTPDKISAESLEIVGNTILSWLKHRR
ncbi:MAG: M28 family peptidase [Chloroflexi bacterium]|nr:M28 family peptidase [Chloroflexota bacterium]